MFVAWSVAAAAQENPLPAADVVVVGRVHHTEAAKPAALYQLARATQFQTAVPPTIPAVVCLEVAEVVAGSVFGDTACFHRIGEFAITHIDVTHAGEPLLGRDGIWMLAQSTVGEHLYAERVEAYQSPLRITEVRHWMSSPRGRVVAGVNAPISWPSHATRAELERALATHRLWAVPWFRRLLAGGTPDEKVAVLALVATYGLLGMVPDVINAIDDTARVPVAGDPIGSPVGVYAVATLSHLSAALDPYAVTERPEAKFGFAAAGIDFDQKHAAVAQAWRGWWDRWRADGPKSPRDEPDLPEPE